MVQNQKLENNQSGRIHAFAEAVRSTVSKPFTYAVAVPAVLAAMPLIASADQNTHVLQTWQVNGALAGYCAAIVGIGALMIKIMRHVDHEETRERIVEQSKFVDHKTR